MRRLIPILAVLVLAAATSAQEAVYRVCTYNLLNYSTTTGDLRHPEFTIVLDEVMPDILIAQEIIDNAAAQQFLDGVLDPGTWARSNQTFGTTDAVLFYRSDLFELLEVIRIPTDLRNIDLYVLQSLNLPGNPIFRIANTHLKASQGDDNEQRRFDEVMALVNYMDANALHGTDLMFGGDFNFYTSAELGYQALLNEGEFQDPINAPGNWHDSFQYAAIHTQSPRVDSFGGGATGGMDDRFDFLVGQPVLFDGIGWDLIDTTYTAFGNDGNHFNQAINDGTNTAVPAAVADALHDGSDHLPVYVDLGYYMDSPFVFDIEPAVPLPTLPNNGGFLEFSALIVNATDQSRTGQGWTEVILPNGNTIGPIRLLQQLTVPANTTINVDLQEYVPAYAPGGMYTYVAKLGIYPSIVVLSDSFQFQKFGGLGSPEAYEEFRMSGKARMGVVAANDDANLPDEFTLSNVYPNPFNESATVALTLPNAERVTVTVHDVQGRVVAQLADGLMAVGEHRVELNARGWASGVYFVRAQTESGSVETIKSALVR